MLYPDETTLRDGYYIRPIGNRWVIVNAAGMTVSAEYRSPLMLTRKLIFARNCYREGYVARARETNTLSREIAVA